MMIYLGQVRCTLFLGLLGPLMTFFCFTLLTTRKNPCLHIVAIRYIPSCIVHMDPHAVNERCI